MIESENACDSQVGPVDLSFVNAQSATPRSSLGVCACSLERHSLADDFAFDVDEDSIRIRCLRRWAVAGAAARMAIAASTTARVNDMVPSSGQLCEHCPVVKVVHQSIESRRQRQLSAESA